MEVEGGEQQMMEYEDHSLAPLLDSLELKRWSFYRATMAEFVATLLFMYITLTTVVEDKRRKGSCGGGFVGRSLRFRRNDLPSHLLHFANFRYYKKPSS